MAEGQEGLKINGVADGHGDDSQPADITTINGPLDSGKRSRTQSDPDAQEMVISSLRSQIQDLFGQVTDLNNKLVKSYDRVSDLEDDLHLASSNIRTSSLKISQLELERTQHLSALNTGLLVEKSHVTAELTRLMEKATEEAAQRGQAESARADIEKDLDDLSATLFGQANKMVAEARYAQHLSEKKLTDAEFALKGAEEVVGVMQQQMQALQADKELAEHKATEAPLLISKGKLVERNNRDTITHPMRLLSSHPPYQEFLLFVAHMRSVRLSSPQPPAMTALLTLPFLARLHNEDSEPTIRLDLAPSLNWLSRRSVLSAIHNGQLIIEPMSSNTLIHESPLYSASTTILGLNTSNNNIGCALCGSPVFSVIPESSGNASTPPLTYSNSNSISWPTALFRKSSQSSNSSQLTSPQPAQVYPPQVYIFRLSSSSSITTPVPPPNLSKTTKNGPLFSIQRQQPENQSPLSYPSNPSPQPTTVYPLCTNKWCLARLRTACSLWAFVRTGIVEKIWEEEIPVIPPPIVIPSLVKEKPPLPPRRRGLWGMASAFNERSTSWRETDGEKARKEVIRSSNHPQAFTKLASEPEKSPEEYKSSPDQHGESTGIDVKQPFPSPTSQSTVSATRVPLSVPPPVPRRRDVHRLPGSPIKPTPMTNEISLSDTRTPPPPSPKHRPSSTVPSHVPVRPARRPLTPASVPLPESRPHTPPVVHNGPSSPSIPAAATPPPIPRRAAARAPRLPSVDGGSRSATPLNAGPQLESITGEEDEKENNSVPPHTQLEEGGSHPSASPLVVEEAKVLVRSEPDDGVGEKSEKAEAALDTTTSSVQEASKTTAERVSVVIEVGEEAAQTIGGGAESVGRGIGGSEDVRVGESAALEEGRPMVFDTEKSEEGKQIEEEVKDKTARPQVDAGTTNPYEDKEVYVGNASWEERTWKEIVRLKGEMFWARIGGMSQ